MSKKDRRPGTREETPRASTGAAEDPAVDPAVDTSTPSSSLPADEAGGDATPTAEGATGADPESPDASAESGSDPEASSDDADSAPQPPAGDPSSHPEPSAGAGASDPPAPAGTLDREIEVAMSARRIAAAADAALTELVATGIEHEAAEAILRSKLEPINEEATRRVEGRGELLATVAAWFEAEATRALAEAVADAKRPKGPPVPPHHVRCRLRTGLSGWGYTLDGHRREHWVLGETGDFKPHVVESAPGAFERLS